MKKFVARFKKLPIRARQLLVIGTTLALVAALPLFIWAILNQRFDIRERASTGEPVPSPITSNHPLIAETPQVSLQADNFYIIANDMTFYARRAELISVHSDPGTINYTTLEIEWEEHDVPMRLYMFFRSDGTDWWAYEIRTYNGEPTGPTEPNDIYYRGEYFKTPVGQEFTGNIELRTSPLNPYQGVVHFDNLKLQAFKNLTRPPTPAPCPSCPTQYGTIVGCQFPDPETGTVSYGRCNSERRIEQCDGTSYCCYEGYWTDELFYCNPTPIPGMYYQNLKFRVKFAGVSGDSADGANIAIRFLRSASGFDQQATPVKVTHVGDGVYEAIISLVGSSPQIPINDGYTIYIKGEKHLSKKFCTYDQNTRCEGDGNLYIGATNAPFTQTFDFTGLPLEPGDLPVQDGKADFNDFEKITSLFTKLCSQLTEAEKKIADLDYNGCINIRDAFLMRKTLETKYDEY